MTKQKSPLASMPQLKRVEKCLMQQILTSEPFESKLVSLDFGCFVFNARFFCKVEPSLSLARLRPNCVYNAKVEKFELACEKNFCSFKIKLALLNFVAKPCKKKRVYPLVDFNKLEDILEADETSRRLCRVSNAFTTFEDVINFWDFEAFDSSKFEQQQIRGHKKSTNKSKKKRSGKKIAKTFRPTRSSSKINL